ncbi:SagB-type dehydrogenase domain containing protein-containing protein [Actinobacteria bacterium OV450]|nr:SagB-type dehydrogenase domain containing protein-containing protein [Actinobacteria bacterium OV450]
MTTAEDVSATVAVAAAAGGQPRPDMSALAFREGVRVTAEDDGVRVQSPWAAFVLGRLTDGTRAAVHRLAGEPVPPAVLLAGCTAAERTQVLRIVDRLGFLITRSVLAQGRPLARIEATSRTASYRPVSVPAPAPLRLSKFALCRSYSGAFVLESPLTPHRVLLLDPASRAVVGALGDCVRAADLAPADVPAESVAELLEHLAGAGFVDVGEWAGGQARFAADEDEVLEQWDFHDLLFHSRSRAGRHDEPFGGIFPYEGRIEPRPAVEPAPAGPFIELHRPALDDVLAADPALTTVLEGRTSVRQYGEKPMTVRQLGEFLYRTARVRSAYGPRPDQKMPYEATSRPYPCGGAAYELELYLTVRRCEGLAEGVYHYDPVGHRLRLVNENAGDRSAMLYLASVATGGIAVPDVLVTMTSRFQRLSWKYRGIAYAVTLKHAGVLYQTMYLVATAMGLAPCGLGSGDADLAARVLGLDYLRESSVGEFMLGSLPAAGRDGSAAAPPADWRAANDPQWTDAARALLDRHDG